MGPAGLGLPQSQGPGAHHKVEPPQYFDIQNLIFMYYFNKLTQLQLNLHNVILFSVNSLNKFSQSIFNYVGYTISPTFKYFNFNFILHTIV